MEFTLSDIAVVVPSYQPDEKLGETVRGLLDAGFCDLCVVDDGGGDAYAPIFDAIAALDGVTVLHHAVNRGKGVALKTAFEYLIQNRPNLLGCVTADGDGQHLPADVLACAKEMCEKDSAVLGSRDFSGPEVPRRSKAGNRITSFVFLAFCGLRIHDTQTGLRAFPARFLPALCAIRGDRYEYETNMLLEAKHIGMPLRERVITTVYLDDNRRSHFNAFRDSIRIYSLILKYISSSLCASLVDLIAFYLLSRFLAPVLLSDGLRAFWQVAVCTVLARLISSCVNYLINRSVVFSGGKNAGNTLLRYFALALPVMAASIGLVTLLKTVFNAEYAFVVTVIKMIVDVFLFFLTFRLQREWVFRKK